MNDVLEMGSGLDIHKKFHTDWFSNSKVNRDRCKDTYSEVM
jgi:hypothetical protein